ncbi:hypothetical protein DRO66_05900 [Candidatus Bathyarchaeota archaeon]|nr:MAG: hypothetical protein DRO66_05900 [Candidatus Bathyarchaeota archaeon]
MKDKFGVYVPWLLRVITLGVCAYLAARSGKMNQLELQVMELRLTVVRGMADLDKKIMSHDELVSLVQLEIYKSKEVMHD